jgi:L-aminopeptidase/D-esterase-like protein
VGGGTGARSGDLRSGVGSASVYLGDGVYVGAIVIVNSYGSAVDPRDCSLLGVRFGIGDEFAGVKMPKKTECQAQKKQSGDAGEAMNTTVAVVATNAALGKATAKRMAGNANDGMARAIDPIHTLYDGDTVFAIATGDGEPLRVNNPDDYEKLNKIFDAGATTLSRAIAKALLSATSRGDHLSYCDTYPSACKHARHLAQWREQGAAPAVTPGSFARASKALQQAPIPPQQDRQD